MPKQKRVNKTKEQLAAEIAHTAETKRLRSFAKDKFYPFLLSHSRNIEHAGVLINALDMAVMRQFNNGLSTTKIADLKLEEMLTVVPEAELFREMLGMFKDESLMSFKRVVSDMSGVLQSLIQEWTRSGTLKDLKSPFPEDNI